YTCLQTLNPRSGSPVVCRAIGRVALRAGSSCLTRRPASLSTQDPERKSRFYSRSGEMARVRLPWPRLPAVRLSRPVMLMVLAAVAGVAAALAARQHIEGHVARLEADAKTPVLERVVAAYDLPAGTRLEPAHLATRPYPAALVPSDSVDPVAHSRLLGMVLQSGLRAGDLIVPAHGRKMQPGAFSSHLGEGRRRSEEHTSELQSRENLVCRLLLEKKKNWENR